MRNWVLVKAAGGIWVLGIALAARAGAQAPGYSAPWDIAKLTAALVAEAQRLKPLVAQADPQKWKDAKAAELYQGPWNSAQNERQYFTGSAEKLAKEPEKLTLAMEAYFRMEALQTTLASLVEGMRRHDNGAKADVIEIVMGDNTTNKARLRQYMTELAAAKEQEFQVADREAQRCRGTLSRQAPPVPAVPPKTKR